MAWMLGPMVANIVASLRGWPVLIPNQARNSVLAVVGVFLGGSFTPDLLDRAGDWMLSLSMMVIFIPMITVLAGWYYHRWAGFDLSTSVFSGAPGTMTAMVIIGEASGADERMIALTQGLRVVIVVLLMPLLVVYILGVSGSGTSALSQGSPPGILDVVFLGIAASAGFGLAKLLRFPASAMTGAMVTSATLYLFGVVEWRPPDVLLWVCLWILGSAVGSRYSTVTTRTFFRISKHAVIATALIMCATAVFSGAVTQLTGTPYLTALASFTPGGVAEMCIIAITFDIDPAFVAVHHLARIALLITVAPVVASLLLRKEGSKNSSVER